MARTCSRRGVAQHMALWVVLAIAGAAYPQTTQERIATILNEPIHSGETTGFQLRNYLLGKVPPLPSPASAEEWQKEAKGLRKQILAEFVFRGWPDDWVNTPLRVEDLGPIPSGKGYRMRKLRYEIVPGFYTTAILYEPENLSGRVPAVLNPNGHTGVFGKTVEYKQVRCINQALHGMIALNLEWFGTGELNQYENLHDYTPHLDLVGARSLGLFYLAIRKALDYLSTHPNVDPNRIGMTGLSGGGFQTILLGALDERVWAAVPVAGFSAATSSLERIEDVADVEQHNMDFLSTVDYPLLVALRAPRPTLLIYNAEDNCCFRAPLVKPAIYDQVQPFFRLFGKDDALAWYEQSSSPTHNYDRENREQSYRFFATHFGMPPVGAEISVDAEIKSAKELTVGLPENNLTVLGVARNLADRIQRPPAPTQEPALGEWLAARRERLRTLVRVRPVEITHASPVRNTHRDGLDTVSYRFDFSDGLSAAGVLVKAVGTRDMAPATLVLSSGKRRGSAAQIASSVERGEQALALDLVLTGELTPPVALERRGAYGKLLNGLGEPVLGLQVSHLLATVRWLRQKTGGKAVRLEALDLRGQYRALIAAAIEPQFFSTVVVGTRTSLRVLLDKAMPYRAAPELFLFGLLPEFDLEQLEALTAPTSIVVAAPAPRRRPPPTVTVRQDTSTF